MKKGSMLKLKNSKVGESEVKNNIFYKNSEAVRIDGSDNTGLTNNIFKADSIAVNTVWSNYIANGYMNNCQAEENYNVFIFGSNTKIWKANENNFLNPRRWYIHGQCRTASTRIDTLNFKNNYWPSGNLEQYQTPAIFFVSAHSILSLPYQSSLEIYL